MTELEEALRRAEIAESLAKSYLVRWVRDTAELRELLMYEADQHQDTLDCWHHSTDVLEEEVGYWRDRSGAHWENLKQAFRYIHRLESRLTDYENTYRLYPQ